MSQVPPQVPSQVPSQVPTATAPGPALFDTLVQEYWNKRRDLLQSIPNAQIRARVEALIDGRVVERVNVDVPPLQRQGVALSFSSLQETQAVFNLTRQSSSQWTTRFLGEAVTYVGIVVDRYMEIPGVRILLENWDAKDGIVATVLAAAGPWLAIQGLAVVGFTASGVAAGSLAALWQSSIGNVVAGSLFSSLQSAGALGALGGPLGLVAGVASVGVYGLYKWVVKPTAEQRFDAMLLTLLQDDGERAQFWASINV